MWKNLFDIGWKANFGENVAKKVEESQSEKNPSQRPFRTAKPNNSVAKKVLTDA